MSRWSWDRTVRHRQEKLRDGAPLWAFGGDALLAQADPRMATVEDDLVRFQYETEVHIGCHDLVQGWREQFLRDQVAGYIVGDQMAWLDVRREIYPSGRYNQLRMGSCIGAGF